MVDGSFNLVKNAHDNELGDDDDAQSRLLPSTDLEEDLASGLFILRVNILDVVFANVVAVEKMRSGKHNRATIEMF